MGRAASRWPALGRQLCDLAGASVTALVLQLTKRGFQIFCTVDLNIIIVVVVNIGHADLFT